MRVDTFFPCQHWLLLLLNDAASPCSMLHSAGQYILGPTSILLCCPFASMLNARGRTAVFKILAGLRIFSSFLSPHPALATLLVFARAIPFLRVVWMCVIIDLLARLWTSISTNSWRVALPKCKKMYVPWVKWLPNKISPL